MPLGLFEFAGRNHGPHWKSRKSPQFCRAHTLWSTILLNSICPRSYFPSLRRLKQRLAQPPLSGALLPQPPPRVPLPLRPLLLRLIRRLCTAQPKAVLQCSVVGIVEEIFAATNITGTTESLVNICVRILTAIEHSIERIPDSSIIENITPKSVLVLQYLGNPKRTVAHTKHTRCIVRLARGLMNEPFLKKADGHQSRRWSFRRTMA